tara:strand:+ start:5331 stop:6101 length:771 start_codon:yes stop_codon:yes gene_type:complete
LKNKFTILGCGSSIGSPWITNYWGNLNKKNKKNIRTRCCAHIQFKNLSVLIDTSPDIKQQLLNNKIGEIDSVIYTHEHSDQTSGIFELRPFYWKNKKRIPVYGSKKTINILKDKYSFCFKKKYDYKPIMSSNIIKKNFIINKGKTSLRIRPIEVQHGLIKATAYIFKKIAYISDCNRINDNNLKYFRNLNYLIIDCLRISEHNSHLNFEQSLSFIKKIQPKKAILTNLHTDLDYDKLKNLLPRNIEPAFDGYNFTF